MSETVERSQTYRIVVGVMGLVFLVVGVGVPLLGLQIEPCYGGRCQLINLVLSNTAGRVVIAGFGLVVGYKGLSIAFSGEEELIE
jgi:hypothetical protein